MSVQEWPEIRGTASADHHVDEDGEAVPEGWPFMIFAGLSDGRIARYRFDGEFE